MPSSLPIQRPPWMDGAPPARRHSPFTGQKTCDVVVLGGGITGLMTAWNLHATGARVVLLEKNHLASGESGATTGFLTRIPDTSFAGMEQAYGIDFVREVLAVTGAAQKKAIDFITAGKFSCDFSSCDTYEGSYTEGDAVLAREWKTIERIGGAEFVRGEARILPFREAVRFAGEGKLNVAKLLREMGDRLAKAGVPLYEESEVRDVEVTATGVHVRTDEGEIQASTVVLATGYPLESFAEQRALCDQWITYACAFRSNDRRFSPDLFVDTFDPYFYFRSSDPSVLILGGRDRRADRPLQEDPIQRLSEFAQKHFGECELTHSWSGSIYHTSDGLPYIFEHPAYRNRVFGAMGFAGNGILCGMLAGDLLANLVSGTSDTRAELFSFRRAGATLAAPAVRVKEQPKTPQWVAVARVADLQEGKPLCAKANGRALALFRMGEDFFALDNTCSHAGGPLCEGALSGTTIQCPLHGAQFDVRSGDVVGPPAVRKQLTYQTRVRGDQLEVEFQRSPTGPIPHPTYWRWVFAFACCALVFWGVQFLLQYFWLSPREFGGSFVRSFALSGATLISLALFSSVVFKWVPKWAKYWRLRRYLGITGFVFITFHVLSVYYFLFQFDLRGAYYSFNPLENPIIFGSIAFPIFMVMALTSTDWAVQKLKAKRWKMIHRFVYLAYWGAIFHFLFINPSLLQNPPGYVLLTVTALTLLGELYWYMKISAAKKFRTWGALVGALIILLYIITAVLMYQKRFAARPQENIRGFNVSWSYAALD